MGNIFTEIANARNIDEVKNLRLKKLCKNINTRGKISISIFPLSTAYINPKLIGTRT